MEPLFFVMAIMGCGDAQTACTEARVVPVHYTSISACQEAMPVALEENDDLSFPTISATCRAQGNRWVQHQGATDRQG